MVIGRMACGDRGETMRPADLVKKMIAPLSRLSLQRRASKMTELDALDMHGDSALSAKLGHECFILVGFRTAKPVIHVRRVQREPRNATAVGEVPKHRQ